MSLPLRCRRVRGADAASAQYLKTRDEDNARIWADARGGAKLVEGERRTKAEPTQPNIMPKAFEPIPPPCEIPTLPLRWRSKDNTHGSHLRREGPCSDAATPSGPREHIEDGCKTYEDLLEAARSETVTLSSKRCAELSGGYLRHTFLLAEVGDSGCGPV